MSVLSHRAGKAVAFATGTVLAGAAVIGAAPVPRPTLPDTSVVQVHDVALTAFDITSLEVAFAYLARELADLLGFGDQTVAQSLTDFGLGSLTPNQLLTFTGLGDMTVGELNKLAGLFGLNQNPISALLAATGLSDTTTLPNAAGNLGLTDLPLANLYNLIGMPDYQDNSLSDLANALGAADAPVSNLYGLLGLTGDSTLAELVNALGIGDVQVDTLLSDWHVGAEDIGTYLGQLGVSPQELLLIFSIDPSSLGSMWDSATDSFTSGTSVQEFADQAGLGQHTALELLSAGSAGDISNATLNDALAGIGLHSDATVDQVLNTTGFSDLWIGSFLSGVGLEYGDHGTTVGDLFSAIPGFGSGTLGGLLGAVGLTGQSTVNDLVTGVPGLDDTTLSGLVTNLGLGDDHLSDIATNLFGDTTVHDYLTDIINALTAA